MDLLALLTDLIGDDAAVLGGMLALSVLGLVAVAAVSALQGRSDVRRRASEGMDEKANSSRRKKNRAGAHASLHRLAGMIEASFGGTDSRERRVIRLQLVQAGFYDARAIAVFFAARLAGAVVLGIGGLLATPLVRPSLTGPNLWMTAAGLAILGYFGPTIYVKRRIARRVDQHRNGFPDFMDLMVVCSEAGLSMEAAIERIARELVEGYPSLAENLYMASLEIRAGKSFTEALERLGQRLAIEEAAMLATLLQQSIELGTSLSQSLRVYSDEMRNKRMSRAEEKAYALPAKLVVPLTLFVFPVLIVTLMFPAVIRVMGALSAGQ
jgi:tight adherence protein C